MTEIKQFSDCEITLKNIPSDIRGLIEQHLFTRDKRMLDLALKEEKIIFRPVTQEELDRAQNDQTEYEYELENMYEIESDYEGADDDCDVYENFVDDDYEDVLPEYNLYD